MWYLKNKKADVLYCGVDENKIKLVKTTINKNNIRHFYEYFTERYNIYKKKELLKVDPPLTENEILQKYKFTNVFRENDSGTKYVIRNICLRKNISFENKILNIIIYRLFNKILTSEIYGMRESGIIDFNKFDDNEKETIRNKFNLIKELKPDYVFFTNAFNTGGVKQAALKISKEKFIPLAIFDLVLSYKNKEKGIVEKIKKARDQREVFISLCELNGIGKFLAYQIFVDFTYIPEFPFSENEFVVAGPGCERGLNYLFENRNGLTYEECLFYLRDNQTKLFKQIDYDYYPDKLFDDRPKEERYLNVMALENCMCEFSKYMKTLTGKGRPRVKYKHKINKSPA